MKTVRRADLAAQPWKNGGGVTREIGAHPPGAGMDGFDWRLSLADVASDGPFSAFPGIDRTLTVIDGAGLDLDFGGGTIALPPGQPLSFPGEAQVSARLTDGAITDLNVMTRRGVLSHHLAVLAAGEAVPAGTHALIAIEDGGGLAAGDTLLAQDGAMTGTAAPCRAIAVILCPSGIAGRWISGAADG